MANFEIIQSAKPYYVVRVSFGDQVFTQNLVSEKSGMALTKQLQEYADTYEAEWVPPVDPESE